MEEVWGQIGRALQQADGALVERDFGPALHRVCQDLANGVGQLAQQLEDQSDQERRELAMACVQDAQLALRQENGTTSPELLQLSEMKESDWMHVISGAATLLRDVQDTLASIEKDEADEIAQVAVTVARLFLASLQGFYESVPLPRSSVTIEEIHDDDEEPEHKPRSTDRSGPNQPDETRDTKNKKEVDRLRVLWPPLGPKVQEACQWGQETASQKPLLAVALALVLWPMALLTALWGIPVVLVDGVVQDAYTHHQEAPLIQTVERTTAQLYHSGRLSMLCAKLAIKKSLRLLHRQVERQGGWDHVAGNAGHWILDRVTHPIDTIGMVWDGVSFGIGAIQDRIREFQELQNEATSQELQRM